MYSVPGLSEELFHSIKDLVEIRIMYTRTKTQAKLQQTLHTWSKNKFAEIEYSRFSLRTCSGLPWDCHDYSWC